MIGSIRDCMVSVNGAGYSSQWIRVEEGGADDEGGTGLQEQPEEALVMLPQWACYCGLSGIA